MADRSILVLQQGKLVSKGLAKRGQKPVLYLDEDETLTLTIDWSAWLDSDTIVSVINETSGVSVTGESNTTTEVSFTVSASAYSGGYIQSRITTAAGQTKEVTLLVEVEQERPRFGRDYPVLGAFR